jgi:zinc transport system permease protein
MPDLAPLLGLLGRLLPFDCLQAGFMQQALLGLLLLAPMTASMGVQVVHFRMAFYTDTISHSAFTGVALGLILSLSPHWSMPIFAVLVGLAIVAAQRHSNLPTDTVIGVFFSGVIAFGLAIVSRHRNAARDIQRFLYGDILTVGDADLWLLAGLLVVLLVFQAWSYNRLLHLGISPAIATAHRVRVAPYQYAFGALLALVVIVAVWAVGVLLVTALLIVPAAAARNFARTAGGMFWWANAISLSSAVAGLLISAQPWARTATGATIILCAFLWFLVGLAIGALRRAASRPGRILAMTAVVMACATALPAQAQSRRVRIREDRGQTAMGTKVYPLRHVAAADLAPFVEQAVKAMNPASSARPGRNADGDFLSVSFPVASTQAVDEMIATLDRAPRPDGQGGIAGTGAVRGWHRPQHRSSEAMAEMLREIADDQAEVHRDPQSGLIYWQGSASADAAIRQALGAPADEVETVHVVLSDNDPKLLTKTYLLRHADPYEVRGILRQAVQSTRITGAAAGVECLKYNDGTGAVIVTAEAYRFAPQPGGALSIDELVATLDQPGAGDPPDGAILAFPQHRRADEVAAGLRQVGIVGPGDPRELDAGDSRVLVDPELNALIVDAPPFDRKNAATWIQTLDQPIPQIRLAVTAYELQTDDETRLGSDYEAWRNGPGAALMSANLPAGTATPPTSHANFAPAWDARFLEALASTGQATIVTRGEGVVAHRQEFRLGPDATHDPGFHLRAIPAIAAETVALDLQVAMVSDLGDGHTSRSGFASRASLSTTGGRLLLGGLERRLAQDTATAPGTWFGRLFTGTANATRTHRILVLLEIVPSPQP